MTDPPPIDADKVHAAPRVSIVMPVFDGAAHLAQSLDSVLAQRFAAFELIVVDDGSTDGTAHILDLYQSRDARIRVIRQAHAGLVAALQRGCDAARGAFIARLDADDLARPDRLERQVSYLDAHPDVGLVGSAVTYIDGAGREIGHSRFPVSSRAIARRLFAGDNVLAHSTVMMRRAVLDEAGGYDPFYRHAEDYALWLRIAASHPIANLSARLVAYRVHAGGTGGRNRLDQILAARTALVAARLRRAGLPDPTIGQDAPSVALFAALPLTRTERRATMLDLAGLALGMMHAGIPATEQLEVVAAVLVPTGERRTVSEIVTAMLGSGGIPFTDPHAAEHIAAFGLHLVRLGSFGEGPRWLVRAALRHPLGPVWLCYRIANRVAMRYAARRRSTDLATHTG